MTQPFGFRPSVVRPSSDLKLRPERDLACRLQQWPVTVVDDIQEGPSWTGLRAKQEYGWETCEAHVKHMNGSDGRTYRWEWITNGRGADDGRFRHGSVMVLKEKENMESERNRQQQVNPSESKQRWGFPSRKAQVGRMQQSTRAWWGKVSTREAKMETRTATLDMILTFQPFSMLLPLNYSEMRQTSRKYAE